MSAFHGDGPSFREYLASWEGEADLSATQPVFLDFGNFINTSVSWMGEQRERLGGMVVGKTTMDVERSIGDLSRVSVYLK